MVKTVSIYIVFFFFLDSKALAQSKVEHRCMGCHIRQKIPSELIYRRYLMKYSTHKKIRKVMLAYLKEPKKENSIMPKQFFLKFPLKKAEDTNSSDLVQDIERYLEYLDIREKFVLP